MGWLRIRIKIRTKLRMKKESNNKGEERVCECVFTIQNMKIMIKIGCSVHQILQNKSYEGKIDEKG
jgi:ribosomal protein L21E